MISTNFVLGFEIENLVPDLKSLLEQNDMFDCSDLKELPKFSETANEKETGNFKIEAPDLFDVDTLCAIKSKKEKVTGVLILKLQS